MTFALSSLPSWAEEAHEAAEEGGLPQFDPAGFPEQIFWIVISFILMYLLMNFLVLPRYAVTQGKRKEVISSEIESARVANEEAKISVAVAEKALSEAREKAQADVTEMLTRVADEAVERQATQEKDLLRKLHSAEEGIAVARAAALEKVRGVALDLAENVVEKVLGVKKQVKA
ncbi:MAG: F0F1 ATP synthase subunit B' [Alphaproteobacteria bacterium]|nr:F0F1 ATP synthase subunit B' [Alphaproteobacteria bacterium]